MIRGMSCDSHKMKMIAQTDCAARTAQLFKKVPGIIFCVNTQGNHLGFF